MKNDKKLIHGEPAMHTAAHMPALFRTKELKWEAGKGSFEGVDVVMVSEDATTGNKAMFLKLPPQKKVNAKVANHYHTATTHNLVLEGSVASEVNGKEFVGRAGDYFRAPANWVHGDSHGVDPREGAIIFMVIEGNAQAGARERAADLETIAV